MAMRSTHAASLGQLRQKFESTARSIRTYKSKLRSTKQKHRSAAQDLTVAERRLEVRRARLSDIRRQLAQTRAELEKSKAELRKIETRLKQRNDLLAKRLADTYKHGSVSYLSVLLGSADFWDLLSRGYVIRKIIGTDVELIKSIKKDRQAIEEHKAALEEKEQRRSELERQQGAETNAALNITAERRRILSRIERNRAEYQKALDQLERDSRRIQALIQRAQETPQGKKRLAQVWRGTFIKPVNGRLTSGFGYRTHPIHKNRSFHHGVDLACPHGTPIKAAAAGTVVFSGWQGAYGRTVIVNHDGGMSTVYGHCSARLVSRGDRVKQGQIIARVGSTGWSTGPHLHFEVRKNGVAVNPF